ncbi:hypothetical protein O181_057408 [Austropuccinia psidii MF-1]|uniref:Uncharacterized protein n=1 Tax=Austropuccinia psidii MF-1 TaxID=1389203 RepID=A0A9Q3EEY3_9BASI|nr:hypothetical protein [Austropuccinia psidii MF-1]
MQKNESLLEKQKETDKMIKTILTRLDHLKNQLTNKQKELSNPNNIEKTNNTRPSFAAVVTTTNIPRQMSLLHRPNPSPQSNKTNSKNLAFSSEQNLEQPNPSKANEHKKPTAK